MTDEGLKIETEFHTNTDNSQERSGRGLEKNTACSHGNENEDKHEVFCVRKITRGTLLFHHVFYFGGSVMRQPQVEDPLHQHLSVAVKIQRFWVADDLIVRVRVQQHCHVAARGPHLNITEADVKFVYLCQCITCLYCTQNASIF